MVASEGEARKQASRSLIDVVQGIREAIAPWAADLVSLSPSWRETDDREWSPRIAGKTPAQEVARIIRLIASSDKRDDTVERRDVVARRVRREMSRTPAREQITRLAEELPAAMEATRGGTDLALLVIGGRLCEAIEQARAKAAAEAEAVASAREMIADGRFSEVHREEKPLVVVDRSGLEAEAAHATGATHAGQGESWFSLAIAVACVLSSPEGTAVGRRIDEEARKAVAMPTAASPAANHDKRSAREWAEHFGHPAEALRKRLDRWRARHIGDENSEWFQVADTSGQRPTYLYSRRAAAECASETESTQP